MKIMLGLLYKKEMHLPTYYRKDILIHSDIYILMKLSIHGGVIALMQEIIMLGGE